ncbi:hypothetical protein FRC07_005021 [Ceratobasidium sp. 392]|nr:hypothetical protein FRC07_005021 [Ceratobasidium sp. 392]
MVAVKSPSKRNRLIELKKKGLSDRAVARELGGIDHTTVNRIYRNYCNGQDIFKPKHGSGRPRKLTSRDAHWAGLLLARGLSKTAADLQRSYFPHLHPDTIRRYLKRIGLRVFRRRKAPFLSFKARSRRRKWGRVFVTWTKEDWAYVAFSDESKFVVFGSGGPKVYWKKRGARMRPTNIQQLIKFGGGNVMVWGCITRLGVGKLFRIEGTLNTSKYIQILSREYLGTLSRFGLRRWDLIF